MRPVARLTHVVVHWQGRGYTWLHLTPSRPLPPRCRLLTRPHERPRVVRDAVARLRLAAHAAAVLVGVVDGRGPLGLQVRVLAALRLARAALRHDERLRGLRGVVCKRGEGGRGQGRASAPLRGGATQAAAAASQLATEPSLACEKPMMSSSADMGDGVMGESQPMLAAEAGRRQQRQQRQGCEDAPPLSPSSPLPPSPPKPRLPSSSYTACRKYVASEPLPLPQPASLHALHQKTDGWFLSRRMRSRKFCTWPP